MTRDISERFRLMVTEIEDYAILMLDPNGFVTTWNEGARRLKGYEESEIIGQHFSKFYSPEAVVAGVPDTKLAQAREHGRVEDESWRVRKDGTRFWANVVITRIDGADGELIGYVKITRDLTRKREDEQKRIDEARRLAHLEQIQENERVLDQIFNESPSFMALISVPEFRFLKSNSAHRKLIRRSDIIGKTLAEVEPGIEAQGFVKLLQEVAETRKPYVGKEVRVHYAEASGHPARTVYLDFIYQPLARSSGEVYAIAAQGYEVTEKVLARKSIENERENFRNLFKQTPEMVCILEGPEHQFVFVNEAHVRALGFDATGMKVREAQPDSVEVHGILDDVFRTGVTAHLNEIPVTVTGRLRHFNLTYSARRDEAGNISGVMILGAEITEQVESRELIKRSSQQLKDLADSISHIVWMTDSKGNIEYYNRQWYDFTGFTEAESEDIKIWKQAIHPEDYGRIREQWYGAIAEGRVFEAEWRMRSHDGSYRWHLVRTVPSKNSDGQVIRWLGTSTDIDEQRRAREHDRVLAETATIFVESLDLDKTLQSLANVIVSQLADWCSIDLAQDGDVPRRAAVAHPLPERLKLVQELFKDYPTDWNSPTGAPNVMRTGKSELYSQITEKLLRAAAKDQRHWELIRDLGMRSAMVVPLSARGKTLGAISIIASESGRVYTERDLEVAEEIGRRAGVAVDNAILYQQLQRAVRTRDEFLSIASHELKTPLTTLGLQAQITNHKLKKGELDFFTPQQLQKFANQVSAQVSRLAQLVDDMLDVSRIQSGKIHVRPERVDLGELAERIVEQLAPIAKSASCEMSLSQVPVIGNWDRSRIEQVLVNLITNAIKYGANKPVEIRIYEHDHLAKIEVRDRGIGISPEHHGRIFERFERAVSPEGITGLGLGLYITKNIVAMHKGEISVQSRLGEGSTFTVALPLDPFSSVGAPDAE